MVPGQDAGDLQGLSVAEGADSESVEELVDEGNAFEAGVVGVLKKLERTKGKCTRTKFRKMTFRRNISIKMSEGRRLPNAAA